MPLCLTPDTRPPSRRGPSSREECMPDTGLDAAATGRRVGVLVVGLGGAVATTAAAGIEMLRAGSNDMAGLPLAALGAPGIAAYRNLHFAGWDLHGEDLNEAAR